MEKTKISERTVASWKVVARRWLPASGLVAALATTWTLSCGREDPYLVPGSLMEEQLNLGHHAKLPRAPTDSTSLPINTIEALYPDAVVDSVYVNEAGSIEAFRFQLHSGMIGIADVGFEAGRVVRVDLYNAFDRRLFEAFSPSYTIYLFHDDDTSYIFDSLGEKLYAGFPDTLILLGEGIVVPATDPE